MKEITTIKLQSIKVLTANGFSHGLVTKRPVTTREARHIMRNILGIDMNDRDCFDVKGNAYPIVALVDVNGREAALYYNEKGNTCTSPCGYDLMMLPEKKEGWVNVYYDNDASSHRGCRFIYDTKDEL